MFKKRCCYVQKKNIVAGSNSFNRAYADRLCRVLRLPWLLWVTLIMVIMIIDTPISITDTDMRGADIMSSTNIMKPDITDRDTAA